MRKFKNFLLVVILLICYIFHPICAQAETGEQLESLEQFGIHPYPSEEELSDSLFSPEGFVVTPLRSDDINLEFSNIEDLDWLRPIAETRKVVLLGESHYFQYIQHLRNRILFALNTFDSYPLLVLERQYSMTPFLNHYLLLKDDDEAERFKKEIKVFLVDESDAQLLDHLRRWNRRYPDRTIRIGCSDIEHNFPLTFQQILRPYFQAFQQSRLAAGDPLQQDVSGIFDSIEQRLDGRDIQSVEELDKAFQPMEALISMAQHDSFIGRYPFLTPEYIDTVIENVKSNYQAKMSISGTFDYEHFQQIRQKAIIRNLTDSRFLGEYFRTGNVIIHGGSYHTPTHNPYSIGENFLREGSYLTYEFEFTKGQTYSIDMIGFAFSSVLSIENFDIEERRGGAGYCHILMQISHAAQQDLLSPHKAYIFDDRWEGFNDFTKLILRMSYKYQNVPLLFQTIPWTALIEQAQNHSSELFERLMQNYAKFEQYDLHIVVPVSPLVMKK